jgi:mannose/fructose/N-acetylgalactosamine-specific phosphotransferase system component IID
MEQKEKLLTKKDIRRSWMYWLGTCELSNSFERLQTLAFAACLAPIFKKLYKDDEELKLALKRHLTFFNTEGIWGSLIHGIVIGLFLPLASAGSWIAGLGPFVIVSLITSSISYYLWHLGYRVGRKSILQVLKDGRINQFITASSVLGMFMMGILSSQYVKISLKPEIVVNNETTTIQSYVDQILPGLLPVTAVFIMYYLIRYRKVKYTNILLGVLAISLLGALIELF